MSYEMKTPTVVARGDSESPIWLKERPLLGFSVCTNNTFQNTYASVRNISITKGNVSRYPDLGMFRLWRSDYQNDLGNNESAHSGLTGFSTSRSDTPVRTLQGNLGEIAN